MTDPILPAVVDRLRARGALEGATVDRVTVGDAAVLVELASTGGGATARNRPTAGLAHRPSEGAEAATDFAGTADGVDLETLLAWATRTASESGTDLLETAVGVAAINALSAPFVDWTAGDPMALLDPAVETVATVGLFRPAFRKFADVDVRVVERRAVGSVSAPEGVRATAYRPDEASAAMAGASVVFVTGSTLIYGGLERYLAAAPVSATVVLIGATASLLPGPAFDAGVDVVAGAAVTDRERVREAIRAGACGTDLHDAGVRKVYAVANRETTGVGGLRGVDGSANNRGGATDDRTDLNQ
ncbi:DUF364 domain-containing protein [Natrinema sp. 1APR25-10V2]|uniref:Rossmann-like domain-containing protein n=1 Tax=Natrinema sp. 1APR25-10V2 TaxID=2951081 RepID=UPI0028749177|nr:DUF364 domain-containing protein [Natrinema sp. 1APR25-10V2]MDS0477811.1 DUF364 domain-containing protein [Natrinema sp. 1APR25-10V2]